MEHNLLRILGATTNERGDLFGRLVQSFFVALGYENFRLNIHKSGREIDLDGTHRREAKRVVAECKATQDPIGGSDINKFVGALDAEKRKSKKEIVGYFVSLSGFTETAIEQERGLDETRVILIDGAQMTEELIKGRMLVPVAEAYAEAGKCASSHNHLKPNESFLLLAHELGFIWAIYFHSNKLNTHFALIHADGQSLATELAAEVARDSGGLFDRLEYLPPPSNSQNKEEAILAAKAAYLTYLANECGEIQLEGLPADQDVGSKRLRLENIFVPSHLIRSASEEQKETSARKFRGAKKKAETDEGRLPLGDVLRQYTRLAILGLPGGGKSTLLKRLAIAYAFPERRALVDDKLPDLDALPLFVRCRQLGPFVRSPILEVLCSVAKRMEADTFISSVFPQFISQALRSGKALVLVDGLDEIANEGDRLAFVTQLRTFLSTYPAIGIVVTSREAGFRLVGGALSSLCQHYSLADFDDSDIMRLTVAWHKEVIGERADVLTEARNLARSICEDQRVRQLAVNPLLLTTLLLVKRWVRNLPTKRAALYDKAIEVLLMTWNVEGHEPLDQTEVLPQLEFVAFSMMLGGVQRISGPQLRDLLAHSRQQMPEVLSYTKIGISELVERVELRSSLLMLSGHDLVEGIIAPMYEFRHLTFQEYLTAKAAVDGFYPNRQDSDSLLSILSPHLAQASWAGVIVLACILGGRKCVPVIKQLIEEHWRDKSDRAYGEPRSQTSPAKLLAFCLADEVQIPPDVLQEALRVVIRSKDVNDGDIFAIYTSKFGAALEQAAIEGFKANDSKQLTIGGALGRIWLYKSGWTAADSLSEVLKEKILADLSFTDWFTQSLGALGLMEVAYYYAWHPSRGEGEQGKIFARSPEVIRRFEELAIRIADFLSHDSLQLRFAATWALVWLFHLSSGIGSKIPDILPRLLYVWRNSDFDETRYVAAWALNCLEPASPDAKPFGEATSDLLAFLVGVENLPAGNIHSDTEKAAAAIIYFYLGEYSKFEQLAKGGRAAARTHVSELLKILQHSERSTRSEQTEVVQ